MFASGLIGQSSVYAQSGPSAVTRIRRVYTTEWQNSDPSGIAYLPEQNFYWVASVDPASGKTSILTLNTDAELVGQALLDFKMADAGNLAYDSSASEQGGDEPSHRLLMLSAASQELAQVAVNAEGVLDPASLSRQDVSTWGIQNAAGMSIDAVHARLLLLDASHAQVVIVPLQADFTDTNLTLERIDLSGLQGIAVRGLAVHPQTGNLFVMDPATKLLYEFTAQGQPVTQYTLADMELVNPTSLTFAPSPDTTDDPAIIHLFIADRGGLAIESFSNKLFLPWVAETAEVQGGLTTNYEVSVTQDEMKEMRGKVVEVALEPPPVITAAATIRLTPVRTIRTSLFSPPSPDPMALAYLPNRNRMLIFDSEVEEMSLYRGANIFETTLNGQLIRTGNTLAYTPEPSGADFNPTTGRLYISDDTRDIIYEVTPGTDGDFGTADDHTRKFNVRSTGNTDAEGLAINPANGDLFTCDGTSNEVYRRQPGSDGRLGTLDDIVTHFDVGVLGISDPEGVEFNSAGNILLVGDSDDFIYEVSQGGALLNLYNITAIDVHRLSGLLLAPGSNNSGVTNFYLADRNVDNDVNPNENDGFIYEFTR